MTKKPPTKRSGMGGPRPGSGRKPLPAGEKLAHRVVAFFNAAEHAQLEALATERGVSLGAAVRAIVNRSLKRRGAGHEPAP